MLIRQLGRLRTLMALLPCFQFPLIEVMYVKDSKQRPWLLVTVHGFPQEIDRVGSEHGKPPLTVAFTVNQPCTRIPAI